MFSTGEKVQLFHTNAVVLIYNEDEVLLYFEKGYTKWVDSSLIEMQKAS